MANLLYTLAHHMHPPGEYHLDLSPLAEDVYGLSLLFSLEADNLSKALHGVESLNLFDLLELIASVLQICLFLDLTLFECANVVECSPNNLLLNKKVIIGGEKAVQVLPELTFQEEHLQDNLLLQSTADIAYDTRLQWLLQCKFESVFAVRQTVPQLDDLMDQRKE